MEAIVVRTKSMPMKVTGSVVLTPKSRPLMARVSIQEAKVPMIMPICGEAERLENDAALHVTARSADGHADADFLSAAAHRVRDYAVDAERRQDQGKHRKAGEQPNDEAAGRHRPSTSCCTVRNSFAGRSGSIGSRAARTARASCPGGRLLRTTRSTAA